MVTLASLQGIILVSRVGVPRSSQRRQLLVRRHRPRVECRRWSGGFLQHYVALKAHVVQAVQSTGFAIPHTASICHFLVWSHIFVHTFSAFRRLRFPTRSSATVERPCEHAVSGKLIDYFKTIRCHLEKLAIRDDFQDHSRSLVLVPIDRTCVISY